MTRRLPFFGSVLAMLLAGSALGQDRAAICDKGDGVFYGLPITLDQVFPVPGTAEAKAAFPLEAGAAPGTGATQGADPKGRALPNQPAVPSGDPLFPDSAGLPFGAGGASCDGGSIVGAVECVSTEIAASGSEGSAGGSGGSSAGSGDLAIEKEAFEAWINVRPMGSSGLDDPALLDATAAGTVGRFDPNNAAANPGAGGADPAAGASPETPATPAAAPRVVRQHLTLRPVIQPGAPGSLRFEPVGKAGIEVPPDLTSEEIAAVSAQIAARNAAILGYRGPLTVETQDGLIKGLPIGVSLPPLPEGVTLDHDPGVLAMGAECGALFRAMMETDRLQKLRAEKVARIKRLKEMLKAERDKAGLLGLVWDSEEADRLERIIAYEEGNVKKIDKELAEHKATIDRRSKALSREEHEREIAAIKADPAKLQAEAERRRAALIEAARDTARARWQMIEGEAAYARQIAAQEAMIRAARAQGQNELADKLEEDKARLEAARDSWRAHAQSMIDSRAGVEYRLSQENAADGIGPATDATSMLLAEGKNPVEVIQSGARDGAREAAERRATADARTLGGTSTETYGALDFANDLYQSNQEIYNDPALFFRRYGAYVDGVGEAAYDNLKGIAEIGVEAADTAGEWFESGLSSATGYEFNTYGHENLDAINGAVDYLTNTDALAIGDLAAKVAKAADRKVSRMAVSGEKGIEEALSTTGYVAGTVLGVEQPIVAGALETAADINAALRGIEAASDAAKVAEGVSDAAKVAEGVSDATKVAEGAKDAAKVAEGVSDAAKVAEGTSDAAKVAEGVSDASKAGDAAKVADGAGDAAKVGDEAADAAKVAESAPTEPPKTEPSAKPEPATEPKPVEPEPPKEPETDPAKVDREAVTEPEAEPSKTEPEPGKEPEADPAKVDREAATEPEAEPSKTEPEPGKEPEADPAKVDREAVTEPEAEPSKTEPEPGKEPEADPAKVDREAATELEAEPSKTEPEPGKEPEADPAKVDREAVTEPEAEPSKTEPEPGKEPEADPAKVDREAVTEPEAEPSKTEPEPGKEPEADPAKVDREAVTEPEAEPSKTEPEPGKEPEPAKEPVADPEADTKVSPDEPAKEPAADSPAKDKPAPDAAAEKPADAAPLPEKDPAAMPAAGETPPTPDPTGSNQPRGPPETPREPLPIDTAKLDPTLDTSADYPFKEPVYNLDDVPAGGKFAGEPAPKSGVPGSRMTAPDGSTIELGKKLGEGGTAKVFANANDPSTVIKIVDAAEDAAGVVTDGVGRKVAEAIQDASGNGNFRVSKVSSEFTVTGPEGRGKWSVKIEENMALRDGFTDASKRFKTRPPNPEEELTMAMAIREMNNRGVVWTDHKPANFDIVPNPNAPTGYQMVIFDTGGIRPVTGANAEARAATAIEVQRTFDRTAKQGKSLLDPNYLTFQSNVESVWDVLDKRVFPTAKPGLVATPNSFTLRPKGDRYLDFAMWSDAELLDYAKGLLGKDVTLPIK